MCGCFVNVKLKCVVKRKEVTWCYWIGCAWLLWKVDETSQEHKIMTVSLRMNSNIKWSELEGIYNCKVSEVMW